MNSELKQNINLKMLALMSNRHTEFEGNLKQMNNNKQQKEDSGLNSTESK